MARIYLDNPDSVQASLEISPQLTKSQRALLADAVLFYAVHEADVQDDMSIDVTELTSPLSTDESALTTRIELPQSYIDSFASTDDDEIIEIPDAPNDMSTSIDPSITSKPESKFKPEIPNEVLVRQAQAGDTTKIDKLIQQNMGYVEQLADRIFHERRKNASVAVGKDDLIQEGVVALWKSVASYKLDSSASFMTYARARMATAMRRSLQPHANRVYSGMGVASYVESYATNSEKTRANKKSTLNRLERLKEMPPVFSLDTVEQDEPSAYQRRYGRFIVNPGRSNPTSLTTVLPDTDPFNLAMQSLTNEEVGSLLDILRDREREILIRRYGIDGMTQMTQGETGREFGVTDKRIGQIEKNALEKLASEVSKREIRNRLR